MHHRLTAVVAAAWVCWVGLAGSAGVAAEHLDLELAERLGWSTNPSSGSGNPLGFGIGGRAGLGFNGHYLGVEFMYYLGSYYANGTGVVGAEEWVSYNAVMCGFELGHDFKVRSVTFRPLLGLGALAAPTNWRFVDTCPHCAVAGTAGQNAGNPLTSNSLYLEPGMTVLFSFGAFLLGIDASLLVLPSQKSVSGGSATDIALTVHLQAGARL
jgi:hypothetical protein